VIIFDWTSGLIGFNSLQFMLNAFPQNMSCRGREVLLLAAYGDGEARSKLGKDKQQRLFVPKLACLTEQLAAAGPQKTRTAMTPATTVLIVGLLLLSAGDVSQSPSWTEEAVLTGHP